MNLCRLLYIIWGFPGGSVGKESACNSGATGDTCSIPGSQRSPGGGQGNSLQYSCLENPMGGGTWWANSPQGRKESDTTEATYHSCMYMNYIAKKDY